MRRAWIWTLLLGLLLGGGAGFGLARVVWFRSPPRGSAFLEGFSFPEAAARAGDTTWTVLADSRDPSPGSPRAYALPWVARRRIVARAVMPVAEHSRFVGKLDDAVQEVLKGYGGRLTGEEGGDFDESRPESTSSAHLHGHPYHIGDTRGLTELWLIGEGERVTVILSLLEGR